MATSAAISQNAKEWNTRAMTGEQTAAQHDASAVAGRAGRSPTSGTGGPPDASEAPTGGKTARECTRSCSGQRASECSLCSQGSSSAHVESVGGVKKSGSSNTTRS